MPEPTGPPTVIVTGGSRGLGAVLVQGFLDDGANVATCSRSTSPAVTAWSSDATLTDRFRHDVLDLANRSASREFVKETLDAFGQIDVLINNAGIAHDGVLGLASDDDIDAVIDLNIKGTLTITKAVVRHMLTRGSGRIVNITSVVGLAGYRGLSVYSASKAALDGFTRSLSRELGPRSITVNSVAPGYLSTEMTDDMNDAQLAQIVRRTPAGRLGEPSDVLAAVRYLVSPGAAFVNGQVLVVDGGLTA
jgi:3-oxoacyl-[acyl-carrier protein] reductase